MSEDACARMLLRAALNPADDREIKAGDKRATCFGLFTVVDSVDERGEFVLAVDQAEHPYVAGKRISAPHLCAWMAVPYQGSAS